MVLSPIELPCGRVLSNRLVKAAMYEHLAAFLGGPPNSELNKLYSIWARGGWGMVITGNVQVSPTHLSLGADMIVPDRLSEESVKSFMRLRDAMKGPHIESSDISGNEDDARDPLVIMQLNHTGRQSPNVIGGRWPFAQGPLSASATRVGSSPESRRTDNLLTRVANALLFQEARAMTEVDIRDTVDSFVRGVRLALESGFDGIQLHAAHGYLLAQFISRKTNLRTDDYAAPLTLLHEIVRAIRTSVPPNFVVGLKLNAADYVTGGFDESDGATHLAEIARWEWNSAGVDFIEISGGDYECPEFIQESSPRQAFFESFSRVAVEAVNRAGPLSSSRRPPLIMLTGGLHTRAQFSRVLARNHAHLLGIARLAVLQPHLPHLLLRHHDKMGGKHLAETESSVVGNDVWSWESQPSPEPRSPKWWPRLVGAGVGMAWYVVAMHRLAQGRKPPYGENWVLVILLEMYLGGLRKAWITCIALAAVIAAVILHPVLQRTRRTASPIPSLS